MPGLGSDSNLFVVARYRSILFDIVRYCSTYSGSIIDIVLFPVDIDTTDFRLVIHC